MLFRLRRFSELPARSQRPTSTVSITKTWPDVLDGVDVPIASSSEAASGPRHVPRRGRDFAGRGSYRRRGSALTAMTRWVEQLLALPPVREVSPKVSMEVAKLAVRLPRDPCRTPQCRRSSPVGTVHGKLRALEVAACVRGERQGHVQ